MHPGRCTSSSITKVSKMCRRARFNLDDFLSEQEKLNLLSQGPNNGQLLVEILGSGFPSTSDLSFHSGGDRLVPSQSVQILIDESFDSSTALAIVKGYESSVNLLSSNTLQVLYVYSNPRKKSVISYIRDLSWLRTTQICVLHLNLFNTFLQITIPLLKFPGGNLTNFAPLRVTFNGGADVSSQLTAVAVSFFEVPQISG